MEVWVWEACPHHSVVPFLPQFRVWVPHLPPPQPSLLPLHQWVDGEHLLPLLLHLSLRLHGPVLLLEACLLLLLLLVDGEHLPPLLPLVGGVTLLPPPAQDGKDGIS